MTEGNKFWKRQEELVLNDTSLSPAANDDAFKTKCIAVPKPKEVTDLKAFTKNFVKGNRGTKPRIGHEH